MRGTAGTDRRGAVIVETVLVTPLLLLIVFGIVEMTFLKRDDTALSSLVHDAGRRAASALVDQHGDLYPVSQVCATPPCSGATPQTPADVAARAVEGADVSLATDAIDELWIYQANAQGFPGPAGNTTFGSCVDACTAYRWNSESHTFEHVSGTWSTEQLGSCSDGGTVGVYMTARHSFHPGVFSGIRISDHAVFSLRTLGAGCAALG